MWVRCEHCHEKYRDIDPSTSEATEHVCPDGLVPAPAEPAAKPKKPRKPSTRKRK